MPRRPRIDLPDIPQHVVQRGHNRSVCFFADDDRYAYLELLSRHSLRLNVDVHAFVLMTNHVHLLVTPHGHGRVSTLMQDIGREFVRTVNAAYLRTGTLWEGRFHACLVESERYLLSCMRYIELNPVRAMMVENPASYRWSSFRVNALGEASDLIAQHPTYASLGSSSEERCTAYRALFRNSIGSDDLAALRLHTRQAGAWGSERFQREIELTLGRRLAAQPPGRPPRALNGI